MVQRKYWGKYMKLYICDPKKNKKCKKTMCYKTAKGNLCRLTASKKYRANWLKRIFSRTKELEVPEVVRENEKANNFN